MAKPFVPDHFIVPTELKADGFHLEPLAPHHNTRDYKAWMSSIEHIKNTPGYSGDRWPFKMSLEQNLVDIQRHVDDFSSRKGFTYSVLDKDEIIGAVYLYPAKKEGHDARVKSWVIASRAELDVSLWETVTNWIIDAWPFRRVHYHSRTSAGVAADDQQ